VSAVSAMLECPRIFETISMGTSAASRKLAGPQRKRRSNVTDLTARTCPNLQRWQIGWEAQT
jgi:hypothetical protein